VLPSRREKRGTFSIHQATRAGTISGATPQTGRHVRAGGLERGVFYTKDRPLSPRKRSAADLRLRQQKVLEACARGFSSSALRRFSYPPTLTFVEWTGLNHPPPYHADALMDASSFATNPPTMVRVFSPTAPSCSCWRRQGDKGAKEGEREVMSAATSVLAASE